MIVSILGNGLTFIAFRSSGFDRLHKSKLIKVGIDALPLRPTFKQVPPARTVTMAKHQVQDNHNE